MIIEWLITVAVNFVGWIGSLFPTIEIPGWLSGLDGSVNGWFSQWDGVGVWVDWKFISTVVAVVLSVWAIGFVIKLVRVILGHIPQFGGNG